MASKVSKRYSKTVELMNKKEIIKIILLKNYVN